MALSEWVNMTGEGSKALDALLAAVSFDDDGLVPAIAQQHNTGEVLMLAWMNRDAIAATLDSGQAVYWSRARKRLWRKGESSGQTQRLVELRLDCDGDALLVLVEQVGVACHTGRRTCFYRSASGETWKELLPVETHPDELYGKGG